MNLTASDIEKLVQGRLSGDGALKITGAASLGEAQPTDVSFLKNWNDKSSREEFLKSKAGVVLVQSSVSDKNKNLIKVENPMMAFTAILQILEKEKKTISAGVHPTALVAKSAKIGARCAIGPYAVVEENAILGDGTILDAYVHIGKNCEIGMNCHLYTRVVLREEVKIGNNCILHVGVTVGTDGYGYFFANGRHNKIPQVGTVIIEDDVEIGASSTIDRAMVGVTRIGRGTKIDNLVQVAHNVQIGQHVLIVAQTGIGGSTRIGNGVVLGGQVGVADHISIGDGAQIGSQGGVNKDLEGKRAYWGTPAIPMQERLKTILLLKKLPEIIKKLEIK